MRLLNNIIIILILMLVSIGVYSQSGWILKQTISQYDHTTNKPIEVLQEGWEESYLLNWNNSGKITSRKFGNLIDSIEYFTLSNLTKKIISPDGTSFSYEYDDFNRLKKVTDDCRINTKEFEYHYYTGGSDFTFIKTVITNPTVGSHTNVINESYQYLDGLGKPIQTVLKDQHPDDSSEDIIFSIQYDDRGRKEFVYEPIKSAANNNGDYQTPNTLDDKTKYEYYNIPDSKVYKETPPSWSRSTTYIYGTNNDSLGFEIKNYEDNSNFLDSSLTMIKIIDPNLNVSYKFTNIIGDVVLSRVESESGSDTIHIHYVYDSKGRLTRVAPQGITYSNTDQSYIFTYFSNDLMASEQIPNLGTKHFKYNSKDLMSYWNDPNMGTNWYAIDYDSLGRIIQEGFYTSNGSLPSGYSNAEAEIDEIMKSITYGAAGSTVDKVISKTNYLLAQPDSVTYSYQYDACGRMILQEKSSSLLDFDSLSISYVIDSNDNTITTSTYLDTQITIVDSLVFDKQSRLIKEYQKVEDNLVQISELKYNHEEQLKELKLGVSGGTSLQTMNYEYKENNFLKSINNHVSLGSDLFGMTIYYDETLFPSSLSTPRYNGDPTCIAWRNPYDINGNVQKVSFEYDFLNRLVECKKPTVATASENRINTFITYNERGNIDSLIRLGGIVDSIDNWSIDTIDVLHYNYIPQSDMVKFISDDAPLDQKSLGYNRLLNIDYEYDSNGNISFDPSRNSNLYYNHLNLPDSIKIGVDSLITKYLYDIDGNLLRKISAINSDTIIEIKDYHENIELIDGQVSIILNSQGYIDKDSYCDENATLHLLGFEPIDKTYYAKEITSSRLIQPADSINYFSLNSFELNPMFEVPLGVAFLADTLDFSCDTIPNSWRFNFFLRDHLGNVRVVFSDINKDGMVDTSEVLSEHLFYPFGMTSQGPWNSKSNNNYLFGGHEREITFDLNYDNKLARFYDPNSARFLSGDTYASEYPSLNPYAFGLNSPIRYSDPTGNNGVDELNQGYFGSDLSAAAAGFYVIDNSVDYSYTRFKTEDDPIFGADGRIIGYVVEQGQGPTQIAEDLNQNYSEYLRGIIQYTDIVYGNLNSFDNVMKGDGKAYDKFNIDFKQGNINPGDILLISDGFGIDTRQQDQELVSFSRTADSLISEKQEIYRMNEIQDRSGALDSDLRDGSAGAWIKLMTSMRRGLKENQLNNEIKLNQQKMDSVNDVKSDLRGGY